MVRDIRLHREHGVNPTMPVCFWCEKERGDIALLGAAYKGEAPRRMVLDYDPCDACLEQMQAGIVIIEIGPVDDKRAPLDRKNPASTPTGRWALVKREAVQSWVSAALWAEIESAGKVLMTAEQWDMIGLPR